MFLVLLIANVAIYVVMAAVLHDFSFSAGQLLNWGGNLGELSLHGEPWRLVSSIFLHAGLQHIFGNMLLLAFTGPYVEGKIGSVALLVSYLVCGVAASLASAAGHPEVVGIGASGAIAGLLGIMVVFYFSGRGPEISGRWLVQVIVINGLYSLAPDVDGLAHLGGFVAGLCTGAILLLRAGPAAGAPTSLT